MSEILVREQGAFIRSDPAARDKRESRKTAAPVPPDEQVEAPPVGYRRVSKRWRILPDGSRDYAALHGRTTFSFLLPVSSRLRTPKR